MLSLLRNCKNYLSSSLRRAGLRRYVASSRVVSEVIRRLLTSSEPCLIARMGSVEARCVGEFFYTGEFSVKTIHESYWNAGVFPTSLLPKFAALYQNAVRSADVLGYWPTPYQGRIVRDFCPLTQLCRLEDLEPYLATESWTHCLEGKKVLVVHPFVESIRSQYQRREMIYPSGLLPDFELMTVKPPISFAGVSCGYGDWMEAFDALKIEVLSCEFDIAIIGCGSYGLPLGSEVKRAGRKAFHLGGAVQILFGIIGERWLAMPAFQNLMNEYWVRPLESERPQSFLGVEKGCYW